MYILIELHEGVLGEITAYKDRPAANLNYELLKDEANKEDGNPSTDEAHLYRLNPKSAAGISLVKFFCVDY